MFNIFPKKKSVNEILEDAGLPNKTWEWTPTQTPSYLQAQQEMIDMLLKENIKLKKENEELKNDWHQPELCDEKIAELTKEVLQLRDLKQENVDLMEILAKYRDGYQGSCYACEPVGELNQKLELRLTAYQKMVEGASETIDKLKKELYNMTMENNSLKVFPIEDKDDVRLQKHPMYPIHWGSLDPDIYEKAKNLTIEEALDEVKRKEITWEEAAGDLALRLVRIEEQLKIKEDNNPLYKHH